MNEAALENTDGLADTEISRLITLSNQASYSRSDILPVREPSPFEPKSLVEIAMAAQKRRDEAKAHAAAEKAMAVQNAAEQIVAEQSAGEPTASPAEGLVEAVAENLDTAETVTSESANTATMDVSAGIESQSANNAAQSVDAAADMVSENNTSDSLPDMQAEPQVDSQNEQAIQLSPEPTAPSAPDPDILKAEYKRGYEAGLAEGQAKAAEQLEKVLQNFEKATLALANPDALDVTALSAQIASRVMALASDRAGQAISDMPEPFAKRIEDLITMVKSETASPTINLNPEDFASIKPLAQNREKLKGCNFTIDETMARGDVSIAVGGVGLVDQISNRSSIQLSEDQKSDEAESSPEISDVAITADADESLTAKPQAINLLEDEVDKAPASDADVKATDLVELSSDQTDASISDTQAVSSDDVPEAEAIKPEDAKPEGGSAK
ncbi:FliH/SctL family protein [Candidatus Puniceispirillum sp.]|uniref:FliH/SctL family protein n=1 Tax=Candidatus Puniceispirillum sp. TaxID=2026719 RepID=UPI003F6A02E6